MTDDVWTRREPDSPCQKICVIEPKSGLCVGCLRTRDEIAHWSGLTREERLDIMATLPERAPRLSSRGARSRRRRGARGGKKG